METTNKITSIILAGGKSKRLGEKKQFLKINNEYFIKEVAYDLLKISSRNQIIIVTNINSLRLLKEIFLNVEYVKIIVDKLPNKGPLGGIYTGLLYSSTDYVFVKGCDMPYLDKDLINYMSKFIYSYDIIVPFYQNKYQVLYGLYSKNLIPIIEKRIKNNFLSIKGLLKKERDIKIKLIKKDEYKFNKNTFFNINTQENLNSFLSQLKKSIDK